MKKKRYSKTFIFKFRKAYKLLKPGGLFDYVAYPATNADVSRSLLELLWKTKLNTSILFAWKSVVPDDELRNHQVRRDSPTTTETEIPNVRMQPRLVRPAHCPERTKPCVSLAGWADEQLTKPGKYWWPRTDTRPRPPEPTGIEKLGGI